MNVGHRCNSRFSRIGDQLKLHGVEYPDPKDGPDVLVDLNLWTFTREDGDRLETAVTTILSLGGHKVRNVVKRNDDDEPGLQVDLIHLPQIRIDVIEIPRTVFGTDLYSEELKDLESSVNSVLMNAIQREEV